MKMKDLSIESELVEAIGVLTERLTGDKRKCDIFFLGDAGEYVGKNVELLRDVDGKYFNGTLEWIKLDIEPLYKADDSKILYQIKLKEYDEVHSFEAESIEYNRNYLKKYYFNIGYKSIYRITFM